MNDENTERQIERIRKLLALSGSGNEHEAAIARRRAEVLMEKYAISQAMLGQAEFGSGDFETDTKDRAAWKRELFGSIAAILGCSCAEFVNRRGKLTITFYGKKPNVEVALYVCEVVTRSLKEKWKAHIKQLRGRGMKSTPKMKSDFYYYFAVGVANKIADIFLGMSEDERRELENELSKSAEQTAGLPQLRAIKRNAKAYDYAAASAGYESGKAQNINIAVGSCQQGKIGSPE